MWDIQVREVDNVQGKNSVIYRTRRCIKYLYTINKIIMSHT